MVSVCQSNKLQKANYYERLPQYNLRFVAIMDEEAEEGLDRKKPAPQPTFLCRCLLSDDTIPTVIPPRKLRVLNAVDDAEKYLRERRIPELIRFLLTKILSDSSDNPTSYLEELLDHCMLFRAGHGTAPVLYEDRHLEAVIKSFDPGHRGWLSAGQVRRLYATLGLTLGELHHDKFSTETVFQDVKRTQESELLCLLSAGSPVEEVYNLPDISDSKVVNVIKAPPTK